MSAVAAGPPQALSVDPFPIQSPVHHRHLPEDPPHSLTGMTGYAGYRWHSQQPGGDNTANGNTSTTHTHNYDDVIMTSLTLSSTFSCVTAPRIVQTSVSTTHKLPRRYLRADSPAEEMLRRAPNKQKEEEQGQEQEECRRRERLVMSTKQTWGQLHKK